jgi:hypothetical protein
LEVGVYRGEKLKLRMSLGIFLAYSTEPLVISRTGEIIAKNRSKDSILGERIANQQRDFPRVSGSEATTF